MWCKCYDFCTFWEYWKQSCLSEVAHLKCEDCLCCQVDNWCVICIAKLNPAWDSSSSAECYRPLSFSYNQTFACECLRNCVTPRGGWFRIIGNPDQLKSEYLYTCATAHPASAWNSTPAALPDSPVTHALARSLAPSCLMECDSRLTGLGFSESSCEPRVMTRSAWKWLRAASRAHDRSGGAVTCRYVQ